MSRDEMKELANRMYAAANAGDLDVGGSGLAAEAGDLVVLAVILGAPAPPPTRSASRT